ncbi:MAG: Asp-tRNA(Asn)/Glu-tRNA(Gln) amidotransferase subunit GatA [Ginsengibacter sp.]
MFSYKGIEQYIEQLHKGEISCHEAVNHYLKKIGDCRHLNAFVEVFESEALERAKELDKKRKEGGNCGKLHGVIIAIKDVICYHDHRITASSAILKGFISIFSSTAIIKLLEEDAIIIGNCNCDEFAMGSTNENSVYGRVKNALDEEKVPGGSSGGSAVAVQAGMCMVSLGSDTGGSVRQPADFCGITGLKPSYGTVSRYGLIAYASSFDQIGIFSNSVEDAGKVLEIINGKDNFDSTVSQKDSIEFSISPKKSRYKIAVLKNALEHKRLDPEIRKSIYELTENLKEDGHVIEEIDFDLIDYIVPAYYVLTTAEASSNLARYDGVRFGHRYEENAHDLTEFYKKTRSKGFGKEVKRRIMLGTFVLSEGYYDAYFTKAQQVRRLLIDQTNNIFNKYDAIIMPTVPSTALEAGNMEKDPIAVYLADIYTVYANLTGTPAISLPLFKHSNGMPFGVQLLANKFNELPLLNISSMLLTNYKQY